jgi:hypothetical protein
MWPYESIHAPFSPEPTTRNLMQKDIYPVNPAFSRYLQDFGRGIDLPLRYTDLLNYSHADSIKGQEGQMDALGKRGL